MLQIVIKLNDNAPDWAQTALYDEEDDIIFLPSALVGNEYIVKLNASLKGIEVVEDEGHIYIPISWIRKEYASKFLSDICNWADKYVRRKVSEFEPGPEF